MKSSTIVGALVVLMFAQFTLAQATDKQEVVVKYVGAKQGTYVGRPCMMLQLQPVAGGQQITAVVPNKDPMGKKLDPVEAIADVAKAAKSGDYFTAELSREKEGTFINGLKPYVLKPGEDEPNVFLFSEKGEKKVGSETLTSVTATKFGQSVTMLVHNKKNADGKMVPDEALMKVFDAAKDGDPLEILYDKVGANMVVKSAKPFELPRRCIFGKIIKQKVEDKELTGIEVSDAGSTVTILIDPKNPNASALIGKINNKNLIKPEQDVMVRSMTNDKGAWLIDIKPAPKEDAPKDPKVTPKPMPKGGAVGGGAGGAGLSN